MNFSLSIQTKVELFDQWWRMNIDFFQYQTLQNSVFSVLKVQFSLQYCFWPIFNKLGEWILFWHLMCSSDQNLNWILNLQFFFHKNFLFVFQGPAKCICWFFKNKQLFIFAFFLVYFDCNWKLIHHRKNKWSK